MECIACGEYAEMEGGPVEDGKGDQRAKFMCPECGTINTIKWGIDI